MIKLVRVSFYEVYFYTAAMYSNLVNGCPTGFFSISQGFRLGDFVSSFLFILAVETFSSLLITAIEEGLISGFKTGGNSRGCVTIPSSPCQGL